MTKHEERAERFALSRHSGVDQVSGYIGRLAAEFAAVEAEARREALTAAHGCHDYNGGHSGTDNAAFHHGVDTVINVLTHLAAGEMDTQLAVVLMVGREALKAKAEEKHGDKA